MEVKEAYMTCFRLHIAIIQHIFLLQSQCHLHYTTKKEKKIKLYIKPHLGKKIFEK